MSALRNEEVLRSSMQHVYRHLPRLLQLTVSEQGFIEFMMRNRERLMSLNQALEEEEANAMSDPGSDKNSLEWSSQAAARLVPTYAPKPMVIDRGLGARLWDLEGNEYLDFGAGIAVSSLGHQDPDLLKALHEQAGKLWHTSNLYLTAPAIELAELLTANSFADRVFFCNSGAEANEAAIKIARKWSSKHHPEAKREIVTFTGSFHGRTLATVTATAQPKYQQGYEPLPGGFRYCEFNNFEAASDLIGPNTCAVMVEPVQGEGGVTPAAPGFLKHLRQLCDQHQALLICDEIQCGLGRTSRLFAHQWDEVTPDIMTLAKALGGGLPIGAMLCTQNVADAFTVGDHGTTFGGNPVAAAVAVATVRKLIRPELLEHVRIQGIRMRTHLEEMKERYGLFQEIRGRGLMLGAVLAPDYSGKAAEIVEAARQSGILVLVAGPDVLRLVPPLTIGSEELEEGMKRLNQALDRWKNPAQEPVADDPRTPWEREQEANFQRSTFENQKPRIPQ